MEERLIDVDFMFITNHQSSEVSHPGDVPFHLPSPLVPPQLAVVLRGRLAAIDLVRADQLDPTPLQSFTQRVGIGRLVVNQPRGVLSRPATTPGNGYFLQRRLDQLRFVPARRGELNSQRNALTACHPHPLRTLSTFGLSDARAPFFAGANEPSAKVSSQLSAGPVRP